MRAAGDWLDGDDLTAHDRTVGREAAPLKTPCEEIRSIARIPHQRRGVTSRAELSVRTRPTLSTNSPGASCSS